MCRWLGAPAVEGAALGLWLSPWGLCEVGLTPVPTLEGWGEIISVEDLEQYSRSVAQCE